MDVGLLLVAVLEDAVREEFDYDEGVAEAVRVQGDDVSSVQNLQENVVFNVLALSILDSFFVNSLKAVVTKIRSFVRKECLSTEKII